jgi:hypothetical protein
MSNILSAFNRTMELSERRDTCNLGELIIMMEGSTATRPVIDDAIGIVGNHNTAVGKAILHLDFLYEDTIKHPPLPSDVFGKYVDSQYGTLRSSLIAALKPNGVIDYEAVAEFEKRHYVTSPNLKTGEVMIRVNSSLLKI